MEHRSELEQAVIEIVEEGKAKDEEGHALYPVMEEPLVMAFFSAYNTLYETLKERPILVLNLMRTNKALEMFWGMFPGMWIKMIDHVLEREVNRHFVDTYSFFAVANYRIRKALAPLWGEINLIKYNGVQYHGDGDFVKRSIFTVSPFNEPGKFHGAVIREKEEKRYQIIYYDPITKLYIQLLQQIHYLCLYYGENDTLCIAEPTICLGDYIHWESTYRNIDCLDDCFVVNITDGAKPLQQDLENMKRRVVQICRNSRSMSVQPNDYPQIVCNLYYETVALADRLLRILTNHFNGTVPILQEAFKPLELDKALAKPYHALLYDRNQGLYNTQDKQRSLLIAVLRNADSSWIFDDNDMIEKYGQATSLRCAICHTETHYVDSAMMRAFCTEQCRSFYTK